MVVFRSLFFFYKVLDSDTQQIVIIYEYELGTGNSLSQLCLGDIAPVLTKMTFTEIIEKSVTENDVFDYNSGLDYPNRSRFFAKCLLLCSATHSMHRSKDI